VQGSDCDLMYDKSVIFSVEAEENLDNSSQDSVSGEIRIRNLSNTTVTKSHQSKELLRNHLFCVTVLLV
jgi:hypothetical protein